MRDLMVKDLANDLVRETDIKKRIKEFLDKPVDQPRTQGGGFFLPSSFDLISTAASFTIPAMMNPPRAVWVDESEPIDITNLDAVGRRLAMPMPLMTTTNTSDGYEE